MAFDLGAALKNVSRVDTGKEQITYLPIGSLDSDPKNFYELRGIEELADNISVAGLQQPIRVRAGEAPGRYTIVSGHRRLAAVKALAQEAPEKWQTVACIIETDDASPALQQLRLIYANANTRQLSSAEISDQVKQVEMLLYELKEEGYEFPGRMRDHVAEAVGVSRSKLARLKVIRDNLIPEFEESWRAGKISEGTAYTLAQNSRERQKLIFGAQGKNTNGGLDWVSESTVRNCLEEMDKARKLCGEIDCFRGCKCDHAAAREQRAAKLQSYSALNCRGCCRECSNLAGCKGSCEYAGDVKQQQIKAARTEHAEAKAAEQARQAEAAAKAEKAIDLAAEIFRRTEELRVSLGLSVEELVSTWIAYGNGYYVRQYEEIVAGKRPDPYSTLPGDIRPSEAQNLVAVADKLGCSVDYLLGRDVPGPGVAGGGWRSGTPEGYAVGDYVAAWTYAEGDGESLMIDEARWVGDKWIMFGAPITDDIRIWWWIKKPEGEGENGS
nr:MAG TPA_asm: chromosome partitioning protein [Caudoviricetes sp.]